MLFKKKDLNIVRNIYKNLIILDNQSIQKEIKLKRSDKIKMNFLTCNYNVVCGSLFILESVQYDKRIVSARLRVDCIQLESVSTQLLRKDGIDVMYLRPAHVCMYSRWLASLRPLKVGLNYITECMIRAHGNSRRVSYCTYKRERAGHCTRRCLKLKCRIL